MDYNRDAAVEYAREWALSRNPEYYDFEEIGGDCTNFASQALFAGSGVMNFTPETGWFYVSLDYRAPAWTSAEFFARFLLNNNGAGPYGRELPIEMAEAGDFIQLSFDGKEFTHTLIIVEAGETPAIDNILIACHSYDSLDRPLNTYFFKELRLIHIDDVKS